MKLGTREYLPKIYMYMRMIAYGTVFVVMYLRLFLDQLTVCAKEYPANYFYAASIILLVRFIDDFFSSYLGLK